MMNTLPPVSGQLSKCEDTCRTSDVASNETLMLTADGKVNLILNTSVLRKIDMRIALVALVVLSTGSMNASFAQYDLESIPELKGTSIDGIQLRKVPQKPAIEINSQKQALEVFKKFVKDSKNSWRHRNMLSAIADFNTYADPFRVLVLKADLLPESLLSSSDADSRGLAAAIIFLGGQRDLLLKHIKLLEDNKQTTMTAYGWERILRRHKAKEELWTVSALAATSLRARGVASDGPLDISAVKAFLKASEKKAVPYEWKMRAERYQQWGVNIKRIKKEVAAQNGRNRAIALIVVTSEYYTKPFSIAEGAQWLKQDLGNEVVRSILEKKTELVSSVTGRKKGKDLQKHRAALLYYAPALLTKTDAAWLHAAADENEWVSPYYIIASARLDPVKGVNLLKKAISRSENQSGRCLMLYALWRITGAKEAVFIADSFFAETKPTYKMCELQAGLIDRILQKQGRHGVPLLRSLIMDKRFLTLSWSVTRAFAENAKLILGEETKEVKRYLSVKHEMGQRDFDRNPSEREKYPVDTKHVLMQTRAFQKYLQTAVSKLKETNDGQK